MSSLKGKPKANMTFGGDCPHLTEQVDDLAPDTPASAAKLADMTGNNSSSASPNRGLSASDTSSDGVSSFLWDNIDRLSSISNDPRAPRKGKERRTVRGPLASLQTDTSEPGDVDSGARFTDWDGESFVYGPNGSFIGTTFEDGCSEITPEDSVSMKDVYREPYEAVSDGEYSDVESIYLDTGRETKYEDRLTRLGYVRRLPDIDGRRHYRIELSIDKQMEEDEVRTALGTISLSSSGLAILNSDGLQPKLASDLETFSNGSVEVKISPISGYGAFAVRDLDPYTTILIERELFNADSFDLYQKLDALTEEQKKAYHTLYGHMRSASEDIRAAIWRTNRFSVGRGGSVFLVGSRFNHACKGRNNVAYSYDGIKKCMVFATKEKISAGSELFIQYGSNPQHLFTTWGFRCGCGGCPGISEDDCKAIEGSSWSQGQDEDWTSY